MKASPKGASGRSALARWGLLVFVCSAAVGSAADKVPCSSGVVSEIVVQARWNEGYCVHFKVFSGAVA